MSNNIGKVAQVMGPVLDIRFEEGCLPKLLNAIEITTESGKLTLEVAQLIGDNIARCIAMGATDGLRRGMDAVDTGSAMLRYYMLAVPQMAAQVLLTQGVYWLFAIPDSATGLRTLLYAVVMTVLYIASYMIQQRWVFAAKSSEK